MREIKFRFFTPDKRMIEDHNGWTEETGINEAIECSKSYGYKIMQCTGLKDKNGKEIYEGDILSLDEDGAKSISEPEIVSVTWSERSAGFMSSNNRYLWLMTEVCKCEIIGNIHENPELL